MFLGPKFQLNTLTSYTTELALTVLFGNIASFLAFYIDQRVECQINIYPFHTFSCLANPMETSKSEVKGSRYHQPNPSKDVTPHQKCTHDAEGIQRYGFPLLLWFQFGYEKQGCKLLTDQDTIVTCVYKLNIFQMVIFLGPI
jgi:hypothetical protein